MFIYPEFDAHDFDHDGTTTGEFIAQEIGVLDEISASGKLTPISTYLDNRSVPDGFQGDPSELDDVLGPRTHWFDSAEGAKSIRGLSSLIRENSEAGSSLESQEETLEELDDLAEGLEAAASQGIRFRLGVS